MIDIKSLFQKAYDLHVVRERDQEAVAICREILRINPDHYNARLLLGIILAETDSSNDSSEAKKHFIEIIKRSSNIQNIFIDKWEEEDPIYQLALSEINDQKKCSALLFLIIDYFFAEGDHSNELLFEFLDEVEFEDTEFLKYILTSIKKEYKISCCGSQKLHRSENAGK